MRLLFVGTANVCRSPLAERLAVAAARQWLGAGAADAEILSAGLGVTAGQPMDPRSARVLAQLGGDPAGFTSRPLVPGEISDADLVLTMTRQQRRAVLEKSPRLLRHTFTLTEAADLLGSTDLEGLHDLTLRERAQDLATRMAARRAYRTTRDSDDVPDPQGRLRGSHREVARTVAAALRPLTAALFVPRGYQRAAPPDRMAL